MSSTQELMDTIEAGAAPLTEALTAELAGQVSTGKLNIGVALLALVKTTSSLAVMFGPENSDEVLPKLLTGHMQGAREFMQKEGLTT